MWELLVFKSGIKDINGKKEGYIIDFSGSDGLRFAKNADMNFYLSLFQIQSR